MKFIQTILSLMTFAGMLFVLGAITGILWYTFKFGFTLVGGLF